MKHPILITAGSSILALTAYSSAINISVKSKNIHTDNPVIKYTTTPTLFIHGSLGGAFSSNYIIKQLQNQNVAQKVLIADVMPTGQIILRGHWTNQAVNPIIQVIFRKNLSFTFEQEGRWIAAVLLKLQAQYGITQYNIVGHSWGGGSMLETALTYSKAQHMPRLNKFVGLAAAINNAMGPADGFNLDGKPDKTDKAYDKFIAKRNAFPKSAAVLNIYGNLNGTRTDGSVPVPAAQSLAYIVKNRAKSYEELELGGQATHAQMRLNPQVITWMSRFLWKK